MADESNGAVDEKQQQDKKQKKHDSGAADLEKVTDFMEENEFKVNIEDVRKIIYAKLVEDNEIIENYKNINQSGLNVSLSTCSMF